MKRVDAAYLAGILDGEGCISLQRYKQAGRDGEGKRGAKSFGYSLTVSVEINSEAVVLWLIDLFGGNYSTRHRSGNRKRQYKWSVYGKACKPILEIALPYMKVKNAQAEIALDFIETIGVYGSVVADDVIEQRNLLVGEMREWNQRGAYA